MLENTITYYKAKIAEQIQSNPALDPLGIYREKYGIPTLNINKWIDLERRNELISPQIVPETYEYKETEVHEPEPEEFHTTDLEGYFNEEEEAVKKALLDKGRFFETYYFPILATEQAYKNPLRRKKELPGGYELKYSTRDVAVYENPALEKYYIGIRGTSPFNALDLYRDFHILATGATTYVEDEILHNIDKDLKEKVFDKNPDKKYILAGHSLGATTANIIQNRYPENIEHSYLFNMGVSPLPTGWKPYQSDKSTHYHITGDLISATDTSGKMKTVKVSPHGSGIKRKANLTRRTHLGDEVQLLHTPELHSLKTFKNARVADKVHKYKIMDLSHKQHLLREKKHEAKDLLAQVMPEEDMADFIRRNIGESDINVSALSENEKERVTLQLLLAGKNPSKSIKQEELRRVWNKPKQLKAYITRLQREGDL